MGEEGRAPYYQVLGGDRRQVAVNIGNFSAQYRQSGDGKCRLGVEEGWEGGLGEPPWERPPSHPIHFGRQWPDRKTETKKDSPD